ncbi:hypothetical protein IAQ61_001398 [Plenodomus lingam]|uniref:Uncharacterized protein n=1 Tax=Leptosphaeria maculans (strain JN3 / isolate v23.1.3 / race Av1-4-5-6-7-8) TaxID=985895 RepID=E4ZXX5_LEPMJ|nr:hypothetical protein LEMA_P111390.1 [Plenodomus lingam JN3]KAH9879580.1 hypothetical protein IAQ61_001398 [Plenodomus lingam]CBX96220.1 hypothetical protein LEMA_P111390.1 [Plenodomus lingam JN3]
MTTTPSPRPSDLSLCNPGPSSSFLKKLLKEINGEDSHASKSSNTSQRTTAVSHPKSYGPRTVWVGGASMAQDARDKLRVADEARLQRASLQGTDGTPALESPSRVTTSLSLTSSTSSRSSSTDITGMNADEKSLGKQATLRGILRGSCNKAASPPQQPNISGLRLPSTRFLLPPDGSIDRPNAPSSPLMFCDIDSDISLTPPDTEPPTSAATDESTLASTWSASILPSPMSGRSMSPDKRTFEMADQPRMLTKKMRTNTYPEARSHPTSSRTSRPPDINNHNLLHTEEFTERTASIPLSPNSDPLALLPQLSSFRPDATPSTPVRRRPRTCSVPRRSRSRSRSRSPSPETTPSWARSLHLVDTEIFSVFKGEAEAWQNNLLCLYCFSRHGRFSKMLPLGYEMCGGAEVLDSHYWED